MLCNLVPDCEKEHIFTRVVVPVLERTQATENNFPRSSCAPVVALMAVGGGGLVHNWSIIEMSLSLIAFI